MGIDHRGAHILMAEQLLNRPNVVPIFDQVRGETVTEGVAVNRFNVSGEWCRGPGRGISWGVFASFSSITFGLTNFLESSYNMFDRLVFHCTTLWYFFPSENSENIRWKSV